MKIEIKEETAKFLIDLVKEMETQNCRGTATPYFYIVRDENWIVAHSDFSSCAMTKQVFVDLSSGDPTEYKSPDDCAEQMKKDGYTEVEIKEVVDNLQEFTLQNVYSEDNVFLTEKACENYIKINRHNLKNPHSYVKYAYRNYEMENLFNALKEIVKELKKGE